MFMPNELSFYQLTYCLFTNSYCAIPGKVFQFRRKPRRSCKRDIGKTPKFADNVDRSLHKFQTLKVVAVHEDGNFACF